MLGPASELLTLGDLSTALFGLGSRANELVALQLQQLSLGSVGVIFGAGLVTSLSPCTLSVLPLTIGYIGGYDTSRSRGQVLGDAAAFALGLASTLAGLGVSATLLGKVYGQVGAGLPLAVALLAIAMGLNLLEVLPLALPSFLGGFDAREATKGLPSAVTAYLAGLTFAFAASPCSTPVLATLLGFVAATEDPLLGGGLLLAYTCGYVSPLLAVAAGTGSVKQALELRQYSAWVTPASGMLLVAGGTFSALDRLLPL